MTAPLIALAIPLLDTALAILRRLMRGQRIFAADRGHIHHRLLERGLTPRRVALLVYALCGVAACFSLMQSFARGQVAGLVLVVFAIGACVGIQQLGYVEFNVAGRLARVRTFRRVLESQLRLHTLEDTLTRADTIDQCWAVVRAASFDFGFTHISMRLDHTVMEDWRDQSPDKWTLHIPLSGEEFVKLGRAFDTPMEPMLVAPLADVLRRTLTPKLPMFQPSASASSASLRKQRVTVSGGKDGAVPPQARAARLALCGESLTKSDRCQPCAHTATELQSQLALTNEKEN